MVSVIRHDGGDRGREGGREVGIGRDRGRRRAERIGEGRLSRRRRRQLRSFVDGFGHLEAGKLGLIVKGLSENRRRGDGERDLEVRRRPLVLQSVGRLGEVESDGGERG